MEPCSNSGRVFIFENMLRTPGMQGAARYRYSLSGVTVILQSVDKVSYNYETSFSLQRPLWAQQKILHNPHFCKVLTLNEMTIDPIQILRYVCEDDIIVDITMLAVVIIWLAVRHNATNFPYLTAISLPLWEHHPTTSIPITNTIACKKF